MRFVFNFLVIISMVTFIFGCSSSGGQMPDYEKIADKITEETAKKLKDQKNLVLIGTGGKMMNDIQAMDMSFNFYQEMDLKASRELIIYVINEYLSAINSSNRVRAYLHEYPFTAKNVEIRIWFFKPDGTDLPLDKIYYVSAIDGILTYYLDLPETYSRKAINKETYEEAQRAISAK